jgi:RNA polymerase sigma factor (TIGR02999 family)
MAVRLGEQTVRGADITQLLGKMKSESGEARKQTYDELVSIVYDELRRRARQQLAGERAASLQPTSLVHEAYERMLSYHMAFEDREHFLNVAATAMRRVLIDRARKLSAVKRGSGEAPTTLSDVNAAEALSGSPELLIDLDRAVETLRPEQIQLTELRFFAGFTLEETAEIMGLKVETAKKRWEVVRTILFDKLTANPSRRAAG